MFDFTAASKKVALFLLGLALCSLVLNSLIKFNIRIEDKIFPQVQLAKINLNQVTLDEISRIKGISVKLGQKIIEYRLEHKEFRSLEELMEIKGVGPQRLQRLKEIFYI